jgi:hypothetical protein
MKLKPVIDFAVLHAKRTALRAAAIYLVPAIFLFAYAAQSKYTSYGASLKEHAEQVWAILRYGSLD